MNLNVLWTSRSNNRKTGNVPNAWIGLSREEAEDSCSGCSMLDKGCYAHHGSVLIGSMSVTRAAKKNPEGYTLQTALKERHKKAKMVRVTALGDIGRHALVQHAHHQAHEVARCPHRHQGSQGGTPSDRDRVEPEP